MEPKGFNSGCRFMGESTIIQTLLGDFHGMQRMKEVALIWLKAFPDAGHTITNFYDPVLTSMLGD